MAALKKPNSLPHAMYSPLTSMGLQGQSSLNSALANATEAAESKQAEDEGEGEATFQLQEAEEVAEEQKHSHLNKTERGGGESHSMNGLIGQGSLGGIEGGLQSQMSRIDSNSMEGILKGGNAISISWFLDFPTYFGSLAFWVLAPVYWSCRSFSVGNIEELTHASPNPNLYA